MKLRSSWRTGLVERGGTGHWPVAAGDPPAALHAPCRRHMVRKRSLPTRRCEALWRSGELGGKLPPRTARLAVPPGFNPIGSIASCCPKWMEDSLYGPARFASVTGGRGSWERLPQSNMKNRCQLPSLHSLGRITPSPVNRFQNLVAAEVTRLKHQEDQSLLTSAATLLKEAPAIIFSHFMKDWLPFPVTEG